MKKILFCIFDLKGGGAEKVLVNLLNNLDPTEFEVTVLAIFGVGVNLKDIPSWIRVKSIFRWQFRGFTHIMKLFSPSLLHKFLIGKEKYDLEVAYLESSPTRIISGAPDSTRTIAWVHTTELHSRAFIRPYRTYKEMLASYNRFDHIAFVSKAAKNSFVKHHKEYIDKSSVIYNIINYNDIISKSKYPISEFSKKSYNIVTVGRLTQVKGYDRLLDVIYQIKKDNLNINYNIYILGIGEQEKSLKEFCKKNQLGNVHFLGYQSNPYKYISKADLFISTSYREGFSTVVNESIILNTPVVTTNTSGMNEILADGRYGLIVDNSTQGIYNGLKNLLLHPEQIKKYRDMIIMDNDGSDRSNIEMNLCFLRKFV